MKANASTPVKALLPLSWLYGAGVSLHRRVRMSGPPREARPHIVSIGNLEAGGSGKTPLAMWILAQAQARGGVTAYVSRGYGGEASQSVSVTSVLAADAAPASLASLRVLSRSYPGLARIIGDEGALVCDRMPAVSAFFGSSKARAVEAAAQPGVDLVVIDDGFQSWSVPRHTDIVLLDAKAPLDGGCLLPAGLLREKPDALRRANAIVFNGAATSAALAQAKEQVEGWIRPGIAVAGMTRRIELVRTVTRETPRPDLFLAVSGIARPLAFERSLEEAGVHISSHAVFRDHHRYEERDIEQIAARMRRDGVSALVTTEKDFVKLREYTLPGDVWVARLEVSLIGDLLSL